MGSSDYGEALMGSAVCEETFIGSTFALDALMGSSVCEETLMGSLV